VNEQVDDNQNKLTIRSRPRQHNDNNIVVHQLVIRSILPFLIVSLRTSLTYSSNSSYTYLVIDREINKYKQYEII
jgi:hypothetical protein